MNKYYTPEIEDLFIGYECELNYMDREWYLANYFDTSDLSDVCERFLKIRTKYLDQEDIERCGWKLYDRELKSYSDWCKFKSKDWELYVQLNDKYFPRLLNLKARGHCYWNGNVKVYCKSINELRKIMKMIGIK